MDSLELPPAHVLELRDGEVVLLVVCPLEDGERVRLGVEHPAVERDEILVREEEVQVLQPADVCHQQESSYTRKRRLLTFPL